MTAVYAGDQQTHCMRQEIGTSCASSLTCVGARPFFLISRGREKAIALIGVGRLFLSGIRDTRSAGLDVHSGHEGERFGAGNEERDLTTIVRRDNSTIDVMANCVANGLNTRGFVATARRENRRVQAPTKQRFQSSFFSVESRGRMT